MKFLRDSKAGAQRTCWLAMPMLWHSYRQLNRTIAVAPARQEKSELVQRSGLSINADARCKRQAVGWRPDFDVTVGPVGKEFQFVPDTVNITIGDTV